MPDDLLAELEMNRLLIAELQAEKEELRDRAEFFEKRAELLAKSISSDSKPPAKKRGRKPKYGGGLAGIVMAMIEKDHRRKKGRPRNIPISVEKVDIWVSGVHDELKLSNKRASLADAVAVVVNDLEEAAAGIARQYRDKYRQPNTSTMRQKIKEWVSTIRDYRKTQKKLTS